MKLRLWLVVSLSVLVVPAQAEPWSSPLTEQTYIMVEKPISAEVPDAEVSVDEGGVGGIEPLPVDVVSQMGANAVDYEAFTVTYLPKPAAQSLMSTLEDRGLGFRTEPVPSIRLPWHRFDPRTPGTRIPSGLQEELSVAAVPGKFLVQFAYPLKQEWLAGLTDCGIERIAVLEPGSFLVEAKSAGEIQSCSVSRYVARVLPYYNADRISAELVGSMSDGGEYWYQFAPSADLTAKIAGLPESVVALELHEVSDGSEAYLRLAGDREDLLQIVESDRDLLSVSRAGIAEPSGERQGQIVAGNHNGVSLTGPGYRSWLNGRGLLGSANAQTVAVIDTGYDDGQHPGTHHPDLENPDRLVGLDGFFPNPSDVVGHGTMVAGIIAGDGTMGTGTAGEDPDGYHYGMGISPQSSLYVAEVAPLSNLSRQELALTEANQAGAKIVNQSWNLRDDSVSSAYTPVNGYGPVARFFDRRVRDLDVDAVGAQPATIVFSAGNYRQNCNSLNFDTVASPATAKNVIAVGATRSYRPSPEPPLDCRPCTDGNGTENSINFGRPPNEDANNIGRVANFSSRGSFFQPYPDGSYRYAPFTRIKPDLVAPGVRVFSTVPYDYSQYPTSGGGVGCVDFYPHANATDHTYGSGTSFAAPVVSGVAALARQWLLDRGTDPSPSLIKAALIATADTLGGSSGAHDHRPSPRYGWGRVNLDRLTDSRDKFYRTDNAGLAVDTGEARSWTRTIDDGSSATYIVLVWSDPPTMVDGDSQVPLVNDLLLKVHGGAWRGNYFNENVAGVDDGYSYEFTVGVGGNDRINTVEAVFIPPNRFTSGQSITISVVGENVSSSGAQKFGLFAYNVSP